MRAFLALCCTLFLFAVPAFADQFQDGKAAYDHEDYQTALKLWQPMADQGNADAQNRLGLMYADGKGVKKDEAEAQKWLQKAFKIWKPIADQGNAQAQVNVSLMYLNGYGVKKDYVQAYKYILIINDLTAFPFSSESLARPKRREYLEARMTPEQIAEGKRLAAEWEKAHPAPASKK